MPGNAGKSRIDVRRAIVPMGFSLNLNRFLRAVVETVAFPASQKNLSYFNGVDRTLSPPSSIATANLPRHSLFQKRKAGSRPVAIPADRASPRAD